MAKSKLKKKKIPFQPTNNTVIHDIEGTTIYAAGALCWRIKSGELQVLIIHRPKYDDWSWPKGKMDKGETIPETAVREVYEEVGIKITLGRRLPTVSYNTQLGPKEVHYWAAHVPVGSQKQHVDGKEVDKAVWRPAADARKILTKKKDRRPLKILVKMYEKGTLDTYPLVIVRHAKAKPRRMWTQAEGDRPLASTGKQQAKAASRLLRCWRPDFVASSPWVRCVDTVAPYVSKFSPKFKTVDALTESSNKRKPRKTQKEFEKIYQKDTPRAVCVHRPTIPTILDSLSGHLGNKASQTAQLPLVDPHLEPGEMLVCQISTGNSKIGREHKILGIERYKPFHG